MLRRKSGFTLVELLVVIGIIALLISVLLPALSRAREAGNQIKCAANLHSIGEGIALYVAENRGYLPASNFYYGIPIPSNPGSGTTAQTPKYGYGHWSAFLYQGGQHLGAPPFSSPDSVYLSTRGWQMFQCPSLTNGGLPPANTFAGNNEPGFGNETGLAIDLQAPRLAYMLNEALTPRSRLALNWNNNGSVYYHWVQAAHVQHSADTIMASELWGIQEIVATTSQGGGTVPGGVGNSNVTALVSNSRRPTSGFVLTTNGVSGAGEVPVAGKGDSLYTTTTANLLVPCQPTDLQADPSTYYAAHVGAKPTVTLDYVGRNHGGSRKYGSVPDGKGGSIGGWDLRTSNFLYVDGHVENKNVAATVYPRNQWGDRFYTFGG